MNIPTNGSRIPPEATNALHLLRRHLGSSLIAVYLHGSAVAAGLRKASDVDLLVIVSEALSATVRARLSADLMEVSGRYPFDVLGRRPLEVIIFRSADLEQMPYPVRAEFVYGEWLREALEQGAVPQAEATPELTLLLAQARGSAIPLVGPSIVEMAPDTPSHVIREAIEDLLPELVESVEGDERNVLLTLSRMWVTLRTGQFVSKDAAADWARPQLSDQAAATLALARDAYLGDRNDDLHRRRVEVSETIKEIRERIQSIPRHRE